MQVAGFIVLQVDIYIYIGDHIFFVLCASGSLWVKTHYNTILRYITVSCIA